MVPAPRKLAELPTPATQPYLPCLNRFSGASNGDGVLTWRREIYFFSIAAPGILMPVTDSG
jgi:hypothetical protein